MCRMVVKEGDGGQRGGLWSKRGVVVKEGDGGHRGGWAGWWSKRGRVGGHRGEGEEVVQVGLLPYLIG